MAVRYYLMSAAEPAHRTQPREEREKVVGIDVVASAIEDAKVNASLNGIDNCDWIVAKAEDALPSLFKHYPVVPKNDQG